MAAKANKFCALRENELERDVDDANGTSFEHEVNEAVKVALSSLFPDLLLLSAFPIRGRHSGFSFSSFSYQLYPPPSLQPQPCPLSPHP